MKTDNLSSRLHLLREQSGFTLAGLAASVGSTKGYLSLLEAGLRHPSLALAEKLAALFGVHRKWFLTGEGPQFAPMEEAAARERFEMLRADAAAAGEEATIRKQAVTAAVLLRLEQLPNVNAETWRLYREQMFTAVDEYSAFCAEHFAPLKLAQLQLGRTLADKRSPGVPKSKGGTENRKKRQNAS